MTSEPQDVNRAKHAVGISNLADGRLDLSAVEHLSEADFLRWTRRVTPQPNDVVFSYETRLGEAALIPEGLKCCLGRRMALLRPNRQRVIPRFLLYAFLGPQFQDTLRARTIHGSTVDRLPLNEFDSFPIEVPSLEEQQRIAEILGSLDDKIEVNRRMNETLEAMARAIFKSWFVDFDPVRAKAEGRQPAGMDAATAALFPSAFEDSPLGKIPKGWNCKPLPEVVELSPSRPLRKSAEATYLDMQNMPMRGHRPAHWIRRPFSSGSRFMNGDTLVARITPCLENGKTAFVDFLADGEIAWGSTEFIVLRPKTPLPPEFGYCLARSDDFRTHAIQNMTGSSGRQRVPVECFSQYWLAVPPEPVARRFGDLVAPLFARAKGRR